MPSEHNREASTGSGDKARLLNAEAELAKAKAELVEAQTAARKAQTPLLDKLILRGLIPVALAIVGPWAAWKFSADAYAAKQSAAEAVESQETTQRTVNALQDLLEAQKAAEETARWTRAEVDRQKAEELATMRAMVSRLSNTLKVALIQMAVAREMSDNKTVAALPTATPPSREDVIDRVTMQMALPDVDESEIEKMAGDAYDAILSKKRIKGGK